MGNPSQFGVTRSRADQLSVGARGAAAHQLLALVDASLCGIIFVAPYFFGGRHDLGRLVFVLLTAIAATAWFTRQALLPSARWYRTTANAVILLAVGLVTLQVVPLPASWISTISPRNANLLPLWHDGATVQLGTWHTLSLTPHESVKSLAMLLCYGLLFVVVAQRIGDAGDIRRLLRWIAISAVIMGAFALAQFFTSDGRFFWFYEHPYRNTRSDVMGSFENRNHCAHFLVLGLGPLVAWLVASMRKSPKSLQGRNLAAGHKSMAVYLLIAAATIVILAILMTRSRGGAVALAAASVMLAALYWRRRLVNERYLYGVAGLVTLVVALLSIYGYDRVVDRLDDFTEGSVEVLDRNEGRRTIWNTNILAFEASWLAGAGAGSHRDICPAYLQEPVAKEYTHAENGYLQVATENGLPGALLLLAGIGLCGYWCVACYRRAADDDTLILLGAAAAGLAASVVHSLVDFVWYIPTCMNLTVILAACALRLAQLTLPATSRGRARFVPRPAVWTAMASVGLLAGLWAAYTFAGPAIADIHWYRYLRVAKQDGRLSRQVLTSLTDGRDTSAARAQQPLADAMIHQLEQVVHWDPACARAHARLADRYMAQFELRLRDEANTMEITQIRDAAIVSAFPSTGALRAWLQRAFGQSPQLLYQALAHAHRTVELCPLQGEGYLCLADLCFLEGGSYATAQAYVDQGLLVRPVDKAVLFRAGVHALSLGQVDRTYQLWSRCYPVRGNHQQKIIFRLIASRMMPASQFVTTFQPDWTTLQEVWKRYRQFGTEDDLRDLLAHAAKVTDEVTGEHDARHPDIVWYWQSTMYSDVGQTEQAMACLRRAYAINPREYLVRSALGQTLLEVGQFAEAEPHIRWCLARRPENKALHAALRKIADHRQTEATQRQTRLPSGIGGWRQ